MNGDGKLKIVMIICILFSIVMTIGGLAMLFLSLFIDSNPSTFTNILGSNSTTDMLTDTMKYATLIMGVIWFAMGIMSAACAVTCHKRNRFVFGLILLIILTVLSIVPLFLGGDLILIIIPIVFILSLILYITSKDEFMESSNGYSEHLRTTTILCAILAIALFLSGITVFMNVNTIEFLNMIMQNTKEYSYYLIDMQTTAEIIGILWISAGLATALCTILCVKRREYYIGLAALIVSVILTAIPVFIGGNMLLVTIPCVIAFLVIVYILSRNEFDDYY